MKAATIEICSGFAFRAPTFEAKMYNQKRNLDGIFYYYDYHIAQLEATDRYKTALNYTRITKEMQ